jgi:hypothetical protein
LEGLQIDGVSAVAALLGTNKTTAISSSSSAPFPTRPDAHPIYYEFCWLKVANTPAKIAKLGIGPVLPMAYEDGWAQAMRWKQWKGIRVNRGHMLLYDLQQDVRR